MGEDEVVLKESVGPPVVRLGGTVRRKAGWWSQTLQVSSAIIWELARAPKPAR